MAISEIGGGITTTGTVGITEATIQATDDYYTWLGDLAAAYAGDGMMDVDGKSVDVTSLTGAAYVTAETQIKSAILEIITNVLKYIQTFEKTIASTAA